MNTKALAAAVSLMIPMVAMAATEATVTDQQEALNARLEQILAKNGISIGGQFRGEVGASVLSGNGEVKTQRDDEQIGYTSADFDLRARPNTATTGRAVFRMHLDHNNFFGAPYAPFETRWLSLDGGALDMLYYHFGSIQQRWTPLTMWSAEPGFLYTPRIFAQQQKAVQDERFLGGNNRNLQGLNLGLRAAVPAASIDSFDVSLLAAKLLSAGPNAILASSVVSKSGLFGDGISQYPDSLGNFDRWALGARGNVTLLKGLTLGVNYLGVRDLKSTFGTSWDKLVGRKTFLRRDSADVQKPVSSDSATWTSLTTGTVVDASYAGFAADSLAQDGKVLSFVLNADVAKLIGNNSLILGLDGEVALASWQRMTGRNLTDIANSKLDSVKVGNYYLVSNVDSGVFSGIYSQQTGNGINVTASAGWKADSWQVKAKGGFLSNDSLFRSDLAQSPVFGQARVFNSEQDYVSGTPELLFHYNTFDALYHSAHRWVAEDANNYAKSPYDKIAYGNYVSGLTNPSLGAWTATSAAAYKISKASKDSVAAQLARGLKPDLGKDSTNEDRLYFAVLQSVGWDRELQLVLPVGEASANRVGPKFGLDFDLMQGGVEVKLDGYMLQEAKGTVLDSAKQATAEKAKFQQIQAGTRVRVDRFIDGWNKPIEISGSVGLSTAKGGNSLNYQSTAINAGLYVGVIKRVAVTGGFQQIKGKDKAFLVDRNLTNIAGGLEFKVQEGATLLAMYNLLKTEYPNAARYNFDQNIWSTKIAVSF